jgi:hypothetical protein
MKVKSIAFIIISISYCSLWSQETLFHVNTGFLLTQVDGDGYGGFKKLGYNFGGGFRFNKAKAKRYLDLSTRINQKGYREVNDFFYDRVGLTYLEFEGVYAFSLGKEFYLGPGLYYGRLLQNYRTLRKTDFAPCLRLEWQFTELASIQSRFAWSLFSIRESFYGVWLNRSLMFEIVYNL